MSRGRAAEKDDVEFLAAAQQRGQLGSRRHVGNAPALWLMLESQFETVAAQLALIDNGEVPPNRAGVGRDYAVRQSCQRLSIRVRHPNRIPKRVSAFRGRLRRE